MTGGETQGEAARACPSCSAAARYDAATGMLVCAHCGTEQAIDTPDEEVVETDFEAALEELAEAAPTDTRTTVACTCCGASLQGDPNLAAFPCPYCGTALTAPAAETTGLRPYAILPFAVDERASRERLRSWLKSLWFAPSGLAGAACLERLRGLYLPYFTFDIQIRTRYQGERGDDYTTTETYTTTENGKPVTKTRQVTRTRWSDVSGRVSDGFDDLLVPASRGLGDKDLAALEPWDLDNLAPFAEGYLRGFVTEATRLGLEDGFEVARGMTESPIRDHIERDIGGDHQRIHRVATTYHDIAFKHLLLPVWMSAYRYGKRSYRFLVNARTGEVQGERPISWAKIAALALGIAVVIAAAVVVFTALQS